MRRILIIVILIIIFILGLKLGDNNYNSNYLLEEEKTYFENEIIRPNNDYQSKEFVPKDNVVNKIAKKVDGTIDKVIEKIKDILKNI